MPLEMSIKSGSNLAKFEDKMDSAVARIPEANRRQITTIAEIFAKEIRKSIKRNFEYFRGTMLRNVEVNNTSLGDNRRRATISVNAPIPGGGGDYAAWNEFAKTGHWVALSEENRPIVEWTEERGLANSAAEAGLTGNPVPVDYPAIFVEPQPFMQNPVQKAARQMRNELRDGGELTKVLGRMFNSA